MLFLIWMEPGDTLNSIAVRFNTTLQAILAANPHIANPDIIRPGEVIIIPGGPAHLGIVCVTLRIGSTGPAVFTLQNRLLAAGFNPGPVDGVFGCYTHNAVLIFQSSKNLIQDGIVGFHTWAALGV